MISRSIREVLDRDPFVPFRVVLSSCEHSDMRDAHSAALLKSEVFLVLPDGERLALPPYLHIASIKTLSDARRRKRP